MVTIYPTYQIKKEFGVDSWTLEGVSNVRELIDRSVDKFGPKFKDMLQSTAVIVNGFHVSAKKGYKTAINDGDQVYLVTPAAGG